jgi:hypothetical protein
MSVTRYFNGLSPSAVQSRIPRHSSASFSSSFVTSCRFWFAANSVWATLVVAACVIVGMRLRIDKSWALIAFAILLSAGLGFWEFWKSQLSDRRISVKTLLTLILGVAGAGFLLWPCLTKGAFVSVTGDAFFYSAFGQYLTDHHRGIQFGLPPIDQYATLLSETRFGTASVLGFFSVLFHSTTAAVLPFYIFLVLLNIFSGFVLLSRIFGCNRLFSLAAGLFAVIGGWTPNALNIGGLDNLLFVSLFPYLIVRLEMYRFGSKNWTTSLSLATLAAAVFYSYPEGLTIGGAIFLPLFCKSLWSGTYRRRKAWRRYGLSACLVLVFISPFALLFFTSLFQNIGIHMSKGAAGIFPGLLSPRFFPAMFGLGQEYAATLYSLRDLVLPFLMLALIILGLATWVRRRKTLLMATMILIMLAIWQGSLLQYDYGLYKILFIGSLIWIPALFRGGTAVACFVPKPTQSFAVTVGAIIFFSWALAQRMEQKIEWREVKPVKWYSDLANLRHRVGNRPVLLVCDTAFDGEYNDFDQEWAVFFLRQVNLKVPAYYGYLAGFDRIMQRAKAPSETAAFVVVNEPIEGAVWKNERFSLLELGSQAKLIGAQSGNPLEDVNGEPFVWLGDKATRFFIVSGMEQTANFSAWLTGPIQLEGKDRQIRISIGGKVWQENVLGALSIEVPLKPGLNIMEIKSQDSPAASRQAEDDPNELPLGLWDYRINSKDGVSNRI